MCYEMIKIQKFDLDSIGIELNTKSIADTLGDWYEIDSVSLNVSDIHGETLPYLAIYVKSIY